MTSEELRGDLPRLQLINAKHEEFGRKKGVNWKKTGETVSSLTCHLKGVEKLDPSLLYLAGTSATLGEIDKIDAEFMYTSLFRGQEGRYVHGVLINIV
jgi:hypothetical protein